MSKNFNLYFSENEHRLLDQSKQRYGNRLSEILKDHLRTLLSGTPDGRTDTAEQAQQTRTARIAALYNRHFGDIKTERDFLAAFDGNTTAAAEALSNRKRRLRTANPELADAVCALLSQTCPRLSPAPDTAGRTEDQTHNHNQKNTP